MAAFDAILIPGGGVREGGVLPAWVASRFERAMEKAGSEAYLMPLSAGTTHKAPPVDSEGFPILEAQAGARYLLARGVESRRILIEAASYDTIGNAYFSRVMHVIPRGFERLLVITSEFHMPRTEAVFRWVYGMEAPGVKPVLEFESVPDSGLDQGPLQARRAKERDSLDALRAIAGRIHDLAELHQWLFTEHRAYAASGRETPVKRVDTSTY